MKDRKRILIVNNNMHIGGVQKSLVNLLQEVHDEFEITLLLFCASGEYMNQIPADVDVVTVESPFKYFGMTKYDTNDIKSKTNRAIFAAITKAFGRKSAISLITPFQKKLKGFDLAISFLHSGNERVFYGGCNEFVLNCVNAEKKITFLHCDFGKINAYSKYNENIYKRFDEIIACSEGCRQSFVNEIPGLRDKTKVMRNFHNYKAIIEKSLEANNVYESEKLKIITVARFGAEKGVLRGIRAFANVADIKETAKYMIIGDGSEFAEARKFISEKNLQDSVILMGNKSNPYPYMKEADLLLIPSYSEAAPMVIGEAGCLGVPILSTETSSAHEMISDTGYGWVCENSEKGITESLSKLVNNPALIDERKSYLESITFNNSASKKVFRDLV